MKRGSGLVQTVVEKGREFVASYVDFTHFVEGIHEAATQSAGHHGEGGGHHAH